MMDDKNHNLYQKKRCKMFLVNDQHDAQFFSIYLFQFSTCFEQPSCSSSEESSVSMQHLVYVTLCRWPFRVQASDLHTKRSQTPTQSDIYQMLHWYTWFFWWWARGCSKHVQNWNKYIEKNCASCWSFTRNYNKTHGQQNMKFCKMCYELTNILSSNVRR
jgi:hypothetical protein